MEGTGTGGLGGNRYDPGITITPDAKAYVYGYIRTLSDLYVVDGLK